MLVMMCSRANQSFGIEPEWLMRKKKKMKEKPSSGRTPCLKALRLLLRLSSCGVLDQVVITRLLRYLNRRCFRLNKQIEKLTRPHRTRWRGWSPPTSGSESHLQPAWASTYPRLDRQRMMMHTFKRLGCENSTAARWYKYLCRLVGERTHSTSRVLEMQFLTLLAAFLAITPALAFPSFNPRARRASNSTSCFPVNRKTIRASQYSKKFVYTGAVLNGKPGTGKGGGLVPLPGDKDHQFQKPEPGAWRGPWYAMSFGNTIRAHLISMAKQPWSQRDCQLRVSLSRRCYHLRRACSCRSKRLQRSCPFLYILFGANHFCSLTGTLPLRLQLLALAPMVTLTLECCPSVLMPAVLARPLVVVLTCMTRVCKNAYTLAIDAEQRVF